MKKKRVKPECAAQALAGEVNSFGYFAGEFPISWNGILGHEQLIESFERVVRHGRLAHSYLFIGPEGIGKRLFAIAMAKALLCENRGDKLAACGQCISCKLIEAQTHPDLLKVHRPEESNELPIEIMRELCRNFTLKPARGWGKIAILDDADDLNEASANCFLKTLEEPPPRSVFFLIGALRERQLPTILSRCQVVRFKPLPNQTVQDLLRAQGVTDTLHLARLASLSGGSPGHALALADDNLWKFRTGLLDGLSDPSPDIVSLSKQWLEFTEKAGKELSLQRKQTERVLEMVVQFLRDALVFRLGGSPEFGESDEVTRLQKFAAARTPERLMELIERCLVAKIQLRRYVQLALIVEGLVHALCE